jgi:hypothetical protein
MDLVLWCSGALAKHHSVSHVCELQWRYKVQIIGLGERDGAA